VVGTNDHEAHTLNPVVMSVLAVAVVAAGVAAAWWFVARRPGPRTAPTDVSFVTRAARAELYGDAANEELVVRPGYQLVDGLLALDAGVIDGGAMGAGATFSGISSYARRLQNGFVRSYALSLLAGAAIVLLALLVVNWQ
jgi:NADH-quinone oxidoreductase subunit L